MDKETLLAIAVGCVLGYMAVLVFTNFMFLLKLWLSYQALKWICNQFAKD